MTNVSIWERQELADPVDEILRKTQVDGTVKPDNYDLLMAQIPALFGDSDKATYLGFRALGFRPTQAMELLGLEMSMLEMWYEETPEMADFELNRLYELQSRVNADIVRLGFMRNVTMFLFRDSLTIKKGLLDLERLTPREYNYFRSIRRIYDSTGLLNLNKAVEPEKHRNNTLVLSFNNNQFEVSENDEDEIEIKEVHSGNSAEG